MPAYLVRLIKNRDIVGIFVADELEELVEAVDGCTDIDACEFAELPLGGIMWTGPAIAVPVFPSSVRPRLTKTKIHPFQTSHGRE